MTIERTAVVWIEAGTSYSIEEVVEMCGLPESSIDGLIACGALPGVVRG